MYFHFSSDFQPLTSKRNEKYDKTKSKSGFGFQFDMYLDSKYSGFDGYNNNCCRDRKKNFHDSTRF